MSDAGEGETRGHAAGRAQAALPGVVVATLLALAAWVTARWSGRWSPMAPDAVVLALLGGIALRALWHPAPRFQAGLGVAGKEALEVAIVLLGAATDLRLLASGGAWLAAGVVATTTIALGAGVAIGRGVGLTRTHALLVSSGNAICGNSAIAAVATVVRAPAAESAASIAYTAVLSIGLVLLLPLLGTLAGLSALQYGALAGMTVYAVPQVLAATYPVSAQAGEVGTLVKLMRVVLLLPWLTLLSLWERRRGMAPRPGGAVLSRVLPPYLVAFLVLAVLRTAGLVPEGIIAPARLTSHALTTLAMGALGLSVEVSTLRAVGWRTAIAASGSLVVLFTCAAAVALLL